MSVLRQSCGCVKQPFRKKAIVQQDEIPIFILLLHLSEHHCTMATNSPWPRFEMNLLSSFYSRQFVAEIQTFTPTTKTKCGTLLVVLPFEAHHYYLDQDSPEKIPREENSNIGEAAAAAVECCSSHNPSIKLTDRNNNEPTALFTSESNNTLQQTTYILSE